MTTIAHLGPAGTNTEIAALAFAQWQSLDAAELHLHPCTTIPNTIAAIAQSQVDLAIVPVENSLEGSVTTTLDALWRFDTVRIHGEFVLPIHHALLSRANTLDQIRTVYSHPQALAQCQTWLATHLPTAQLVPTNSSTEAVPRLTDPTLAVITPERAAQIYHLPIVRSPINDSPDNCTRFWVLKLDAAPGGDRTTLGFSVQDAPGALLKPLQVFAQHNVNLSRIESRPTKRSLGEYLFFVDLEADTHEANVQAALEEMTAAVATLKIFGSYATLPVQMLTAASDHPVETGAGA
jgi:prephenate dehydratase